MVPLTLLFLVYFNSNTCGGHTTCYYSTGLPVSVSAKHPLMYRYVQGCIVPTVFTPARAYTLLHDVCHSFLTRVDDLEADSFEFLQAVLSATPVVVALGFISGILGYGFTCYLVTLMVLGMFLLGR